MGSPGHRRARRVGATVAETIAAMRAVAAGGQNATAVDVNAAADTAAEARERAAYIANVRREEAVSSFTQPDPYAATFTLVTSATRTPAATPRQRRAPEPTPGERFVAVLTPSVLLGAIGSGVLWKMLPQRSLLALVPVALGIASTFTAPKKERA